ncbi:uncharacterized protein A1O9_07091 [Exophiala aquamarina CBS 119918]|uniref:Uncharacterized protein n=1 Tax=Exophiala aquamarina CBS 119918 TaxID=1182545 RepID=A0A072PAJ8_9EURO|nr:uncharacterized protein A1O9_07091 [Exophiala aquamarina CBS 119918]KEF56901.1 hypothetical protein A1O9_07091 [Exophiala aquamarina CBS 119918]
MSWMDSWSRPGKHAPIPPPLYLTQGDHVAYCRTCGRVIGSRKTNRQDQNPTRYCSDRCRHRKPNAFDKKIEQTIVDLLNSEPGSGIDQTAAASKLVKGDRRIVVTCDEIGEIVFGSRHDPFKTFGRKKNRASRALGHEEEEWRSVDVIDRDESLSGHADQCMLPHDLKEGPRIRPAQTESEVNGSIGGEKGWAERHTETSEELVKRQEGQRVAEEREMIRRAARRLIAFGYSARADPSNMSKSETESPGQSRKRLVGDREHSLRDSQRKCEAVINGAVVEPSFAKGNWAIRWRETT